MTLTKVQQRAGSAQSRTPTLMSMNDMTKALLLSAALYAPAYSLHAQTNWEAVQRLRTDTRVTVLADPSLVCTVVEVRTDSFFCHDEGGTHEITRASIREIRRQPARERGSDRHLVGAAALGMSILFLPDQKSAKIAVGVTAVALVTGAILVHHQTHGVIYKRP